LKNGVEKQRCLTAWKNSLKKWGWKTTLKNGVEKQHYKMVSNNNNKIVLQ
jgi:hypothetical protein